MSAGNERGVTLIELMIVIVLLGIIVAIAVPSYRNYVLRSNRTDATVTLLKIRAAQEKFFLNNDRYATSAELDAAPPKGLGFPSGSAASTAATEHGYYDISSAVDPTAPAGTPSFMLTATPIGGQLQDNECRSMTINDRGDRGAVSTSSTVSTTTCWR